MTPRALIRRAWRFVVGDIWELEPELLPPWRAFGLKFLRVLHLVCRGFYDDQCPLHASALTFSTLMAIVPMLAISLTMVRGFGGTELVRTRLHTAVEQWTRGFTPVGGDITNAVSALTNPQPPAGTTAYSEEHLQTWLVDRINHAVDAAFAKIENVSFAALGSVGLVLLLWMIIQVLGNMEHSFNTVWSVTAGRSLWRKFTDYTSVIIVTPFLIVAATTLPVADLATQHLNPRAAAAVSELVGSGMLGQLTALLITTLGFTFVSAFRPSTRVRVAPALAGGLLAALLFLGWLTLCAALQVGAARYGKFYGSFAVVPILLAWVYVSWEIVLLGAEVAFAVQNCATYQMEPTARQASAQARLLLALSVVTQAGRSLLGLAPAFETAAFARARRIPVRYLNEIVDELVQAGFLAELAGQGGTYVLLKAPAQVTAREVVETILRAGVQPEALGLNALDRSVGRTVALAAAGLGDSVGRTSILDLVNAAGDDEPAALPVAPAASEGKTGHGGH